MQPFTVSKHFWRKHQRLFLLFATLPTAGCIMLHVYPPLRPVTSGRAPELEAGRVTVTASYATRPSFAEQEGSLFSGYVNNADGPLEKVIETALRTNPERYLSPGESLALDIKEFTLVSKERWFSAVTSVRLRVLIRRGAKGGAAGGAAPKPSAETDGNGIEFIHEEKIESSVTEFTGLVCTLTVVGLLFYGPYVGFRGTLEDQLNYLGRTSVAKFLKGLEVEEGAP